MAVELPSLPAPIANFVNHVNKHPETQAGVVEAVESFKTFESKLREVYAQHPDHSAASEKHLVSIFDTEPLTIRARDFTKETTAEKEKYLLALPDEARRKNGSPATVRSKNFKTNFNLFSESSLVDLDWSNVVCAGSAVITSLLPIDAPHNESKVLYAAQRLLQAADTLIACTANLLPRNSCTCVRCRSFLVRPKRRTGDREDQANRD